LMALRKNLILRRPQSGRLEGRMRIIQLETEALELVDADIAQLLRAWG